MVKKPNFASKVIKVYNIYTISPNGTLELELKTYNW